MKHTPYRLAIPILLVTVFLSSLSAFAAPKPMTKPKPKPPASPTNQARLGTTQLSGENAQIGTTYTLGKTNPINFTLNKVEYTLEPVVFGNTALWPIKNEKLLVLHYTLHNPNPRDFGLAWSTLQTTAVDANDKNWRSCANVGIEETHERCNMALKPGQKVRVYTCIVVPAQGQIPKLMFQGSDKQVLRYDIRGKAVPFPVGIADSSDSTGATAPEVLPGQIGTFYPLRGLHAKIDSIGFSTTPVNKKQPKKGCRYLVVVGTAKNNGPGNFNFLWSTFGLKVKDADGGDIRWNGDVYYASRDDKIHADLARGDELRFRYVFEVPDGVKLKSFAISQASSHTYSYDLTQVQ